MFVVGPFSSTKSHKNGLLSGNLDLDLLLLLVLVLLPILLMFISLLKCDVPDPDIAFDVLVWELKFPVPLELAGIVALDLPKIRDTSVFRLDRC